MPAADAGGADKIYPDRQYERERDMYIHTYIQLYIFIFTTRRLVLIALVHIIPHKYFCIPTTLILKDTGTICVTQFDNKVRKCKRIGAGI